MSESCETCKFFKRQNERGGNCHRYPPNEQISYDGDWGHYESSAAFPWIEQEQWCGEHSALNWSSVTK